MRSLGHTFAVLQCLGFWRPVQWLPGWKTKLYDTYTCIMGSIIITVTLSELIEMIRTIDNVETFADNSFMLLTMIGVCGKAANFINKRCDIIDLTDVLEKDPCRPNTEEEVAIQEKFDRMIRSNSVSYAGMVAGSISLSLVLSFIYDIPERSLPLSSWIPFDYSESLIEYLIVYSQQIIAFVATGSVHVIFDTLVIGLMLQTIAQIKILKHRFVKMPELLFNKEYDSYRKNESNELIGDLEKKLLAQRVQHHLEIFKFAETSNDVIKTTLLLQYAVSTLVLCVSVIEISSTAPASAAFVSTIIYFSGMLTQIFIFCFYGCEVTFESLNVASAIYEMDWTPLSLSCKRSLLIIMARSLRPIEYSTASIITVNLDSFNKLVKLSYSAYNLMQQSSQY